MSKKNRYADVRTFLCMVGIAVMIVRGGGKSA
jgi:hypothetical protein